MADSDFESKNDELERDNLQKAISDVERTIASSPPGSGTLTNFVENAKGRVATLDKKIKEAQAERQSRVQDQVSIASFAQKEAALSDAEKQTYSGFLGKEFFTKKDFGSLESFYAHTWDRLSDGGKDEMSKRVWVGVRRDEYKFTDLPKVVQEKESERAYRRLRDSAIGAGGATGIPESDRKDFIRAYESGEHGKAGEILNRESFRENMFLGATAKETKDIAASRGREAEGKEVAAISGAQSAKQPDQSPAKTVSKSDMDASALNLDGLKMAEAPATISSRDIPTAPPAPKGAQSFRGG